MALREARPFLIGAAAFLGLSLWIGWTIGILLGSLLLIGLLLFFRDPERTPPTNPLALISPADGKVICVDEAEDPSFGLGKLRRVGIFLSVLDVHVNRYPCDGVVSSVTHTPGKYLDARTPESAKENESTVMVLAIPSGERIGVKQISGAIARRIVCATEPGRKATRAHRYGMIKFGSTTELILPRPKDVTVHVKVGDRVTGGVTILATLGAPR